MKYVIANICGDLRSFEDWKKVNGVLDEDIIIAGNFIGRDAGLEILKHLVEKKSNYKAVLSGRYEKALLEWAQNGLFNQEAPTKDAFLMNSWLNRETVSENEAERYISFLSELSVEYQINGKKIETLRAMDTKGFLTRSYPENSSHL